MKIIIKADEDFIDDEVDAIFHNDYLDNYNFVELTIDDKNYTFSVEDLYRSVELFNNIRLENKP